MPHVLIVGAGPAGASLAYLLAHRGIEVTLLERQRDFGREFRGEILNATGLDALEQMGLGAPLAGVAAHEQASFAAYMNGREFASGEIDPEAFGGRRPTAISQPELLETIVAQAEKSEGFRFERGASVMDLHYEGARVAGVRLRTQEGERELRADLVVGCDGRASVVRKRARVRLRRSDPPLDVVWCKLPLPSDWPGVRAYLGRGHLLIAYHTWDHSLQLGWVILKGSFGELRKRGIEEWVEEMANHVSPDFAAHLRAHRAAVERPFLLDAVSDCVECWHAPGMLLLGDAAHAMSPVGGQGLNIALRDAVVAANQLVPVLRGQTLDEARLTTALCAIEAERMREVRPIQALQALPPKLVLNRAWWAEPLRRTLAVLLGRPFVQRRFARQVRGFISGVTDVRLEV